jgi:hypothetical protein
MRIRHVIAIGVTFLLIAVGAVLYVARPNQQFKYGEDLAKAVQAYSSDQTKRGMPPKQVSLSELVAKGFFPKEKAADFEGVEFIFYDFDSDKTQPQNVLAVARLNDGTSLCVMGDGSIQQFNSEQLEEVLRSQPARASSSSNRTVKPGPQ